MILITIQRVTSQQKLHLTEWDGRLSDRDGLDCCNWRRCHGTYDRVALFDVCSSVCVCLHFCRCTQPLAALPWHLRPRSLVRYLFVVVCVFACMYVYTTKTALPWHLRSRSLFDVCLTLCVFACMCVRTAIDAAAMAPPIALRYWRLFVVVCLHVYMCIRQLTALPWHLRSRWCIPIMYECVCLCMCM